VLAWPTGEVAFECAVAESWVLLSPKDYLLQLWGPCWTFAWPPSCTAALRPWGYLRFGSGESAALAGTCRSRRDTERWRRD